MTRLPLTFVPLLEMAERAAPDLFAVPGDYDRFLDDCDMWAAASMLMRRNMVAHAAVLFSDLTQPAPQALWLRWLAERLGVPVPVVGAPCWYLVPKRPSRESRTVDGDYLDHDDGAPAMWVLAGDGDERTFAWWDPDDGPPPARGDGVDVWIPSWPDAPVRALVLAILTVGGAP